MLDASLKICFSFCISLLYYTLWLEKENNRNLTRVEGKLLDMLIRGWGRLTFWLRYIPVQRVNLKKTYMDNVVSRFGLKAEGPLRIRVDGLAGGLVLVLVFQSDLVAALLLHAFRQAADGDLSTYTKTVGGRHQN